MQCILNKINEGGNQSFFKLATLFYSKDEYELKELTDQRLGHMKLYCEKLNVVRDKYNIQRQELLLSKEQNLAFLNNSIDLNNKFTKQDNVIKNVNENLVNN